jgi:nucleotide-binding universal stress UspA family protein
MTVHVKRGVRLPSRIVVGLDEKGLADAAVTMALALGRALDARVELIHVVPALPDAWPGLRADASEQHSDELLRAANEAALAHVRQLVQRAPDTRVSPESLLRVVAGRPARVLMGEAQSPGDLIMLGSKRRSGLLHFGGTLRTLLAKARCSVWVQSQPAERIRRILAPIDLSEHSLEALALAVALASKLSASIHVLHAFHVPFPVDGGWFGGLAVPAPDSVEDLRGAIRARFDEALATFEWHGVEHEHSLVEDLPARAILEQAKTHDLVVMGTHGHTGLAAAVLGNTAWSVMEHCDRPLLVARSETRSFAS